MKKNEKVSAKKMVKKTAADKIATKVETVQPGANGFEITVYNMKGKQVETVTLDKGLFDGAINKEVLYQAVVMYNANKRQGTASTKSRGEVSGGGKKPFRQKGTGRARAGSTRSPLWRHGGTIFGPLPRDYHYDIPKKVKRLAFLSSINSKLIENKIIGIDALKLDSSKTKIFIELLKALKLKNKTLIVLDTIDKNIKLSSRNIPTVVLRNHRDFNTMDVLNSDIVLMSKISLEKLSERFKD